MMTNIINNMRFEQQERTRLSIWEKVTSSFKNGIVTPKDYQEFQIRLEQAMRESL